MKELSGYSKCLRNSGSKTGKVRQGQIIRTKWKGSIFLNGNGELLQVLKQEHGKNKHLGRLTWHPNIKWRIVSKLGDQIGAYNSMLNGRR